MKRLMVIAIDGGGTGCRLALDRAGERIVVETGPANVSSDFQGAITRISAGLEALASAAEVPVGKLMATPAYLGLAGVTGLEMAASVAEALPLARCRVEEDRHAAVHGALAVTDSAIAHCGTGSFLAVRIAGATRFAGGWGPELGDEASAQWLGRKALSAALIAADGLSPGSPLIDAIKARVGAAPEIIAFASTANPQAFGDLAPLVTDFASDHDAVAVSLMAAGADYISNTLRQMGWRPGMGVCLTGSLAPCYRPYLPADMRADLVDPRGSPMDGAVALARAFAES